MTRRIYARHAMAPRARFEYLAIVGLATLLGIVALAVGAVIGALIVAVTA